MDWNHFSEYVKRYYGLILRHREETIELANGFIADGRTFTAAQIGQVSRRLSSIVAAGTSFGGTGANVEALLGSGYYDIPANSLVAGDVIRATVAIAVPTTVSTDTLRARLRVGGLTGTAIYDSTAINVSNGDFIIANLEFTIRTIGATGTAYVTGTIHTNLGGTEAAAAIPPTALTGLDTTAALRLLAATGVWSTENANACAVQQYDIFQN